jgi:hypothetical protein
MMECTPESGHCRSVCSVGDRETYCIRTFRKMSSQAEDGMALVSSMYNDPLICYEKGGRETYCTHLSDNS